MLLDRFGDDRNAACAVAVADNQVGARPLVAAAGGRRHGVAIDQHGGAEIAMQPHEQAPQGAVIGLVQGVDAVQRFGDRDALIVDFLGVADHARDGAESAGDPHRAGIGERRQPAVEHARIEFVGLAVDVDIAAREMRAHDRVAARVTPAIKSSTKLSSERRSVARSSRDVCRNSRG
jgi:hypothetical protein